MISQVNFTDQGMYRCVASNPAGSATAAASLTVKGKSKYRIFFPESAGYDNKVVSCSAVFTCSVVYFIVFCFSLFGELYCHFALCALAGPFRLFFRPFEVIMKSFGTKKITLL